MSRPAGGKRPRAVAAPQLLVVDRGRPRTSRALLRRVVATTLAFAKRSDLAVSLLLTDDREIAQLHAEFLQDATPTDVISFALDDTAELVVSVETAAREAAAGGHALAAEVALYVVHGLLHVCGYDDLRVRDRARMRAAEQAVLQQLQLQVAPVDEPTSRQAAAKRRQSRASSRLRMRD